MCISTMRRLILLLAVSQIFAAIPEVFEKVQNAEECKRQLRLEVEGGVVAEVDWCLRRLAVRRGRAGVHRRSGCAAVRRRSALPGGGTLH